MSLLGKALGRYKIAEQIGEGGMGVVYRAEDTALGRSVAVKVLRGEGSRNPDRVRRFSQEARAASALNHPNIITIHDIGEFEGQPFLVMEWVEGESLRAAVDRGPLPLRKLLDLGIQAATALARAHESGITHRDLKPENILVRPDGYVKILDFGLAKLKEREAPDAGAAATADATRTTAGGVVGTAAYMAPEQALGREADGRSDVFSLALVLFECWQGRNPFWRTTVLDTLHSIVHDRLPALSFPPAGVEWALTRILEKALEKDSDERYQTMKDLAIDLRRLKQDSESGKIVQPPASGLQPALAPAARARPVLIYAGVALALAVVALVAALVLLRGRKPPAPAQAQYVQITNFTDSAVQPALSPDGRMLAFIRGSGTFAGPGQIYIKLLPDGEPVQVTHDDRPKMCPVFSPDGSRIAYTAATGAEWHWDTWVVPVLGGEPRLLLPNASGLTWVAQKSGTPRLLFSELRTGIHMVLVTATESRAQARDVYVPPSANGMAHFSYLSHDGQRVLLAEMDIPGWMPCRLVPFDGSSAGRPVGPPSAQCTSAAWSPDGRWMYFTANTGAGFHIWRQGFPDGQPEQVTTGATEEEGIAFAPDGRSFISAVGAMQSSVWFHDTSGDRQVSTEGFAYLPSFSADGSKLYYLVRGGPSPTFVTGELWVIELASGRRERLLPDFVMTQYDISPDGKRVLFAALDAGGKSSLWLASLDRRFSPRQLSSSAFRGLFAPGGVVIFQASEGTVNFIYRMKEDGSGREKVTPDPVLLLFNVSPDGQWLTAWVPVTGATGNEAELTNPVLAYPTAVGKPRLICNNCVSAGGWARSGTPPPVSWTPDGKFFCIGRVVGAMEGGRTYFVPIRSGQALPELPPSGIKSEADVNRLPGVRTVHQGGIFPGPSSSVYAFCRITAQRNLYRIPVP